MLSESSDSVDGFTSIYRRRIYHADTDAGGVVHHARYLVIFEEARMEWLSEIGHSDVADYLNGSKALVVLNTRQQFLKPIRLGDIAQVGSQVVELGKARLAITYKVFVNDECRHNAHIDFACLDLHAMRICQLPTSIQKLRGSH